MSVYVYNCTDVYVCMYIDPQELGNVAMCPTF